jgi:mono/diheme cytochrome c family protein
MHRTTRLASFCWLALILACGTAEHKTPPPQTVDPQTHALTYWQDMAPLFADHCMQCHRAGGIAPFRLDDYAQAKSFSTLIAHVTRERSMPPWSATSDGSCGEFAGSLALSDDEIERIGAWAEAGAQEGTRQAIDVPELPTLPDAREFTTPLFVPKVQGGELAAHDEYRCFELDPPSEPLSFITGYEVIPGSPEIVHHVVVLLVDADAAAEVPEHPTRTNREQMRVLDDESPDREGWPCFGQAGDGLTVDASPVVWAPGQGVVRYPNQSGVPLRASHRVIAQVHYNLADSRDIGKSDQTRIRLRIEHDVKSVGIFVVQDSLLDTLFDGDPVTLPAGQTSTLYNWSATAKELGMGSIPEAQLYGVMPHMHQLGHTYQLTVTQPGEPEQCAADVQRWDFHWQRMYFYAEPIAITPDTKLSVSCDFDTSGVSMPVKPGWGTNNEMCLATLYFTIPRDVYGQM